MLLLHFGDDGAKRIVDEMGRLARTGQLDVFATITVPDDFSRNVDDWTGTWHTALDDPQAHSLLSGLANRQVAKLRLVALTTEASDRVAEVLDEAMDLLGRASLTTVGMQTTTTQARIAVTARGHAKPSRNFFGAHPTRNLIAIPFDRFDDSTGAEPLNDVTNPAFAAHGAVEVCALCGLWLPMDIAPIEAIDSKAGDASELAVRFTQSRIRSLHASTVSLYELFGERAGGSLPVPSGFEAETSLSRTQSDALVDAILAGEDSLVYDIDEFSDPVYSQQRLLKLIGRGLKGALKEFPGSLRLIVAQEARTVVRLALERSVAPHGGLKVMDQTKVAPLGDAAPDAPRVFSGRSPFPGEMWNRIMDRVFATIDGDKRSDDIRMRVFGDANRLPVKLDDLLDGVDELPGILPQLALGEENATLFGQARQSLAAEGRGSFARPSDESLLQETTRRWTEVLDIVETNDAELHRFLATATPFDWTSDLLTLRHAEETDNRHRAKAARLAGAGTAVTAAVEEVVGYSPDRILWIAPEDEVNWRPPLRAVTSREATGQSGVTSGRRGLLMGITNRLEAQRVMAAGHVEELRDTLRVATTGEASFAVPAIVYLVMALGLMGLFFTFLTSELFFPVLNGIPDDAGSGNGYGILLVCMLATALSLTNLGIGLGWLKRLLAFAIPTAIVVIVMAAFAGLIDLVPRGRSLVALHVIIGLVLATAWIMTQGSAAEIRHRVARAATMLYALFLVMILAVLASRGVGVFALLADDLRLEALVSLIIEATSWVLFGFPFLGIWFLRVQKRIHLENVADRAEWAADQLERAEEAEERFRLGMTQWNVTACSIAQVLRQPYGPLHPSNESQGLSGAPEIRRAQVANLTLTPRGQDSLRNQLRSELVQPGWLKRQSEVRIRTYQEYRAQRQNTSVVEFLEQRPEMDPLVPTSGEICAVDDPSSPRLEFAVLGDRGAFDEAASAPIGDRNLLEILGPMLQDPALHRIVGTSVPVDSAAAFLAQALPAPVMPRMPLDEVHAIEGSRGVDDRLQQHLWWPESIKITQPDDARIVERTRNHLIVDGSEDTRDSVQLLAVRVDVSAMFDYYQLTNVLHEEGDEGANVSDTAESGPRIFG